MPGQESKIVENRKKSQPFSVLFTGIVMPDGYGDEEHLENMFRAFKNFLTQNNYNHIKPIILLGCFADKKAKLIEIMKKDGLLSQNTLETDDCFKIQEKNPLVFLMSFLRTGIELQNDESPRYSEDEHDSLRASAVFREKLKDVFLIFNISNAGMLEKFQDAHYGYKDLLPSSVRIVHFPEHGCKLSPSDSAILCHKQYVMGFKEGMFFNVPPEQKREDVLLSIKDEKLLALLLNQKQPGKPEQAAIDHFMQNVQFFPTYYKFPNSFYLYLLAYVKAPVTQQSKKSEILVFSNVYYKTQQQDAIAIGYNNPGYLKALYDSGIGTLELVTPEKKIVRNLRDVLISYGFIPKTAIPAHKTPLKTLRIINTWAPSEDFIKLFTLAAPEGIVGAAGDKSLETGFANSCFVLYEMRSYKAKGLREEIQEVFKDSLFDTVLVKEMQQVFGHQQFLATCIWNKVWSDENMGIPIVQLLELPELIAIAQEIARHLTHENLMKSRAQIQQLVQTKNLYKRLPEIFSSEIQATLAPADLLAKTNLLVLSFLNSCSNPVTAQPSKLSTSVLDFSI